ncbi:MAG: acyl-protein synthetase [Campylobacterales bacterium]|nr:acyl-protein synthetase [Campylobacterales bacterium]
MNLDTLMSLSPYSLTRDQKEPLLLEGLRALTEHHRRECAPYARILEGVYGGYTQDAASLEALPFVPVRLFKQFELRSCPQEEVLKTLSSSGTTSQQRSKIYLDRDTAALQSRVLVKIMQDFLGKTRLPMLIIDTPSTIGGRHAFSARAAGIMGLSTFGRDHTYVLDDQMHLDVDALERFVQRHGGGPMLIFGFTFMVWQYFYQPLKAAHRHLDLSEAILIHSGGWKSLIDQAVDNATFKAALRAQTSIGRIHDFYGMVEQVGSIFVECEEGHLHTPLFSDVLIRDPMSFAPLKMGQSGLIELFSLLPRSYPGHVLLSEDLGVVLGEDDCACGRKGKYFKVHGRLPKTELRGCSDTHAQEHA